MRSAFSSFTTCRSSAAARPRDRRQTSAATITWWRTRYAPTSASFFLACDSDSFSPISTSKTSFACCKNGSASRTARRHSRVSFQATTTRRSGSAPMASGTSRTGRPARSTRTPGSASFSLCLRPMMRRSAARASRKSSSPGGSRALRHSMRSSERPWARKVLPLSSKRAATFCKSYWLDSVSPTSPAMNAGHSAYPATPIRVAWKRSARLIASSILRSESCSMSTWTISVENDIAGSGLRPSTKRTDRPFRSRGDHGGYERCSASPPPAAVPRSEYIEALLLLAIERGVKRVERRPQGLHGLRHDLEPVVHHLQFGFRRRGQFRLARRRHRRERLARGRLQIVQGRALGFVRPHDPLDPAHLPLVEADRTRRAQPLVSSRAHGSGTGHHAWNEDDGVLVR